MSKLTYIKDFDTYFGEQVFEGLNSSEEQKMVDIFCKPGPIKMSDGTMVDPHKIVDWIIGANGAISNYINQNYSVLYENIATRMNLILLRHSSDYETMAVDKYLNLYINAEFVYNLSKIAKNAEERNQLIGGVLIHELYHILFEHIKRGKIWCNEHGKTWGEVANDLNLAADIEVNQSLIHWRILTEEQLVNKIKGIYLKASDANGGFNVEGMERCLNDEAYMEKLRAMHPGPLTGLIGEPKQDKDKDKDDKIETSSEWDKGYKDAWNKLAGLISKYGYKTVWTKLQEQGIINPVGEFDPEHDMQDIMTMEFLTIKSFDEFINESNAESNKTTDKGQTYNEGFREAAKKIISQLRNVMQGDDEDGEDGMQGGLTRPKLKSNLDEDELEPINLPTKNKKKNKGEDGDDVPSPFMGGRTDDDNEDNKQKKGHGNGSSQKTDVSDQEIKDFTDKLVNGSSSESDSKKRNPSGNSNEKESNDKGKDTRSIGGTGSFIDPDSEQDKSAINRALKESGYDKESIEQIENILKQSETTNSKERVEYAKKCFKAEDRTGFGKFLKKMDDDLNQSQVSGMWKEIMKNFLSGKTRYANSNKKAKSSYKEWTLSNPAKNISGMYNQTKKKLSQDPQDLNVYVDVSGSMDTELLRIISQTLVEYTKQFKFSNINICPWASTSNGVFKVKSLDEQGSADAVVQEILNIISKGALECGGGTNENAAMAAMIQVIGESLNNPEKIKKDDVHVIITDGYFNHSNIESRMDDSISHFVHNTFVSSTAVKNTFWMIYDNYEKDEWKKEIKKGKLIFVSKDEIKKQK